MDLASQKSAAGRTGALDAICRAFCKKYVPDFVDDRRVTLTDIVERALKKGKGAEVVAGCNLCILLCLQLDSIDNVQDVLKDLKSIFVALLNDAQAEARRQELEEMAVQSLRKRLRERQAK